MKTFKITMLLSVSLLFTNFKPMELPKMHRKLAKYTATLEEEFGQITEERQAKLKELGDYIYEKQRLGEVARIIVICSHNSRRSHMGQLWLKAASIYYGIENVAAYSGGTEATAFNPRAVTALKHAGFKIHKAGKGDNPHYEASIGVGFSKIVMFSKKFGDRWNPQKNFAAVLVCSEADAACPLVPGADARMAIPYEDPKNFDGTPSEAKAYEERCRQIAREMFFVVKHAKQLLIIDNEKVQ